MEGHKEALADYGGVHDMKRAALIVGVNRYEDPEINQLEYAESDAMDLFGLFRWKLEFDEVKPLLNPGSVEFIEAARQMSDGLSLGDLMIVFFAGHGISHERQQLLLCPKARHSTLQYYQETVPLDLLIQETGSSGVNRLMIVDACRAKLLKGLRGGNDEGMRDVQTVKDAVDTAANSRGAVGVLWSCDEGQKSREIKQCGHGLFTYALTGVFEDCLKQGSGVGLTDGLEEAVYKKMIEIGGVYGFNVEQRPWSKKSGILPAIYEPTEARLNVREVPAPKEKAAIHRAQQGKSDKETPLKIEPNNDLSGSIKKQSQTNLSLLIPPVPNDFANKSRTDYKPLLKRAYLFLEDGDFDNADKYLERVLDRNPEEARAYIGKLMILLKLKKIEDISNHYRPLTEYGLYNRALRFSQPEHKKLLLDLNKAVLDKIEEHRRKEEKEKERQRIENERLQKERALAVERHLKEERERDQQRIEYERLQKERALAEERRRLKEEREREQPKEIVLTIPGSEKVPLRMRLIPAGKFMMGSPSGEQGRSVDECPQHQVTISKAFYMGIYEVTQAQWQAVMGTKPSSFGYNSDHPVEGVSWNDCQRFIQKLNTMGIGTYRLPTEAEWEYACRAGSTTRFSFGDDESYSLIEQYAWYRSNSSGTTHTVGQKKPNAWGLYDMHGNVWECCSDWYYNSYSAGIQIDPKGAGSGSGRVIRGGSWYYSPQYCRSADRVNDAPSLAYSDVGFRLVRNVP